MWLFSFCKRGIRNIRKSLIFHSNSYQKIMCFQKFWMKRGLLRELKWANKETNSQLTNGFQTKIQKPYCFFSMDTQIGVELMPLLQNISWSMVNTNQCNFPFNFVCGFLGYACFCLDHEGFGNSEGLRGYFKNYNDSFRDPYLNFIENVKNSTPKYASLPLFTIGQSLGGLLSITMAIKNPNLFTGTVLLAPATALDKNLYPILRKVARLIAFFFPKLGLGETLMQKRVCLDQNTEIFYLTDPLMYHGSIRASSSVGR